ncbi:MAG: hypothetical protein GX445_00685 [Elusimicrobia bacterium]|jgi:hypothetical protein|nr:hypothetical protein [Elusimicrobiota bacterium]
MIKINLSPKNYVDKIYSSVFAAKVALGGISLFIILFVLFVFHYTSFRNLQVDYYVKQKEYELLKKDVDRSNDIQKQINEINNYISAVDKINKNRFLYIAFMQDIVNNLPETMWFGGITTVSKTDHIEVSINLNSNSLEDMVWWYSLLDKSSKRYSNVKISQIMSNGDFYNTQLTFSYDYEV